MEEEDKKIADWETSIHHIYSNIYLGNKKYTEADLKKYNITQVLRLNDKWPYQKPSPEMVTYHEFPIHDTDDFNEFWDEIMNLFENVGNTGENILVQCNNGIHRSPLIVVGYLMNKLEISYREALSQVQAIRTCVESKPKFELWLSAKYSVDKS